MPTPDRESTWRPAGAAKSPLGGERVPTYNGLSLKQSRDQHRQGDQSSRPEPEENSFMPHPVGLFGSSLSLDSSISGGVARLAAGDTKTPTFLAHS